jgi:hypothetical protein
MTYFDFVKQHFFLWLIYLGSAGITHCILAICGCKSETSKIIYEYNWLLYFISGMSCILIISYVRFKVQKGQE